MKKRIAALLLAVGTLLALMPTAFAAGDGGYADSGFSTVPKLTKSEIAWLLADNPSSLANDVFLEEPRFTAPYYSGIVRDDALQAALDRLNAMRRLAGLPAVTVDAALSQNAQYGAVIQAAYRTLNHFPAQPEDMDDAFYQQAKQASSSSNLSAGRTLIGAVDGLMLDNSGSNLTSLGHRRWQLNPTLGKVGFGYAYGGYYGTYVAEKVFDSSGAGCDYDFIAWPASGWFPQSQFAATTPWSVTLNPQKYSTPSVSAVAVTLTRESDGQSWTFNNQESYSTGGSGRYFNVNTEGYGVRNCIIFRPDGVSKYEGVYTVTITGLKTKSGAGTTLSYQVNFFDPDDIDTTPAEPEPETPKITFSDVQSGDYFYDAVAWAVENGVTDGTGDNQFSPKKLCSEGEILTMLWRAKGKPAASPSPLTVASYYQDAVNWAYGKGMINESFDQDKPCTRASAVMYIWQAAGEKNAPASSFSDVSAGADYAGAVNWAVDNGVTKGTGGNQFSPDTVCTREQIVTFLYRVKDHLTA